jgi:hypothetical protein
MKFIVRYKGEWHAGPTGRAIFRSPWIMEYGNIAEIPIFFKHYFDDMRKKGLFTLEFDLYEYQIRYD